MQKRGFSGKKAQLTMFMLLGIFMIGIFAFLWYIGSRTAEQQLAAPTEKIIIDLLKTGAIPYYITACLENVSGEALLIAGQQGGNIFQDQGGTAPNPTKFIPLGFRVPYGISMPFLVNGTDYPFPPGYPGGNEKSLQVPYLNFRSWGRFGDITLRKLCDSYGANSPYIFGDKISAPICLNNLYGDTLSTQWQLERYIEKKIANCTNWTAIKEETGYNVTPKGDINVSLRLGLSDIWVDAFIPIEVKVGGREPIYTVADFHYKSPVRLKRIVELAALLTTYDSYGLNFSLAKDYKLYLWDSNIYVTVDTPMKAMGIWDDIVTIEDRASQLSGKNYVFRFARENRHPTLDRIHKSTNWTNFDFVIMENDTIIIEPNKMNGTHYDPDEDNLTYYYTGWKETCDEEFNFDIGIPRSLCSRHEPTPPKAYFLFPNQGARINTEFLIKNLQWKDLDIWSANEFAVRELDSIGDYPETAPLAWSTSDAYKETGRNATFIPTHKDIGPHNVTVWACDEGGLCDYQIVKIWVFDFPQLQLNGTNHYKDIPYDRASVEDFYQLSADGSTAHYSPLLGYIFRDNEEPFEIITAAELKILDLPLAKEGHERDIRYIWNYTFNKSSLCADRTEVYCSKYLNHTNHTINLTVTYIDVPPKSMNVSVYQCLPHRDPAYPDPWPYNDPEIDPYLASHVCCSLGPEHSTTLNLSEGQVGDNNAKIFKIRNEYFDMATGVDDTDIQLLYDGTVLSASGGIIITRTASIITIRIPSANLASMPKNILMVKLTKKTDVEEYPSWGSWLPTTTACYGGSPVIGAISNLTEKTVLYQESGASNNLGASVGNANDIGAMTFTQFCSGERGNICSGNARTDMTIITPCDDMNITAGEVESCQGPSPTLRDSTSILPSGETCGSGTCQEGKCIDGKCYVIDASLATCTKYGTTAAPGSFEQAYGLNKRVPDDIAADGICNPNPTCSDSQTKYDYSKMSGRFLIKNATCGAGECTEAASYEDCNLNNGRGDNYLLNPQTNQNDYYCIMSNGKLMSRNISCETSASAIPRAGCTKKVSADPDEAQALCDACLKVTGTKINAPGYSTTYSRTRTTDTTKYCCGDDVGEGGYPYGITTTPTTPSATRNSGGSGAGSYTNEICDDYYAGDKANGIDNNCNGKANCKDTSACNGQRGPRGSYCCSSASSCTSNLFESNTAYLACSTNTNWECDCKPANSLSAFAQSAAASVTVYRTTSYSSNGVKTCVASSDEYSTPTPFDRHMKINVGTGTISNKNIQVTAQNVDGGIGCSGNVQISVWDNNKAVLNGPQYSTTGFFYIALKNGASKDCLATIIIT